MFDDLKNMTWADVGVILGAAWLVASVIGSIAFWLWLVA